jgi:hypothetical protein
MTRHILVCTLASLWLGTAGCGKKSAAPPPANGSPAEMPAANAAADSSVDLAALTQTVRRYGMERQKAPQSLAEVVAAGYLKTMPAAPAGKKFVIEPKRLEVILVNQ